MDEPRFSIGIDLATSNSVIAYVDRLSEDPCSTVMPIAQLNDFDVLVDQDTLPSFLYLLTDTEASRCADSFVQKFPSKGVSAVVGQMAMERAAHSSSRVVQSAKSWLCHGGVNRKDPILPWGSDSVDTAKRLSPIEVSAAYLRHIKNEWNKRFAFSDSSLCFQNQSITITVPASFDAVSQRLTLEAAKQAGYGAGVRLLEEPQAAFYFWLESFSDSIEDLLTVNGPKTVLVCDIGGGTTDFSFFKLEKNSQGNRPSIIRTAVSDHLLLGGDNIDLAIAYKLEERIAGEKGKLSTSQWVQLVHQSRILKEEFLSNYDDEDETASYSVNIVGASSSLFASTCSAEMSRAELIDLLQEGFFPMCDKLTKPLKRQAGFTEWGLPFVADSAVTHHLAEFLKEREVGAVLFTGGTLAAPFLRQRLVETIASWQGFAPKELENPNLMLAVAHGASYSAALDRGSVDKIQGGYSHSVYLEIDNQGIDDSKQLVCVLPKGAEEGAVFKLDSLKFSLLVDQVVRFQFYYSHYCADDKIGQLIQFDSEKFIALPPMQTVLSYSDKRGKVTGSEVEVMLETSLNEIGVLELHCLGLSEGDSSPRWQLDFNTRQAEGVEEEESASSDYDIGVSADKAREATRALALVFGKKKHNKNDRISPKPLVRNLEKSLGLKRAEWNSSLLRFLWSELSKGMTSRGRSLSHETTWCYLAGFCLRPGYGAELDAWRITELWRVFHMGMSFPKEKSAQVQWWIMWRRVAGGLSALQQNELFQRLEKFLQRKGETPAELIRLVGSLERLDLAKKEQVAKTWIKRIADPRSKHRDDYIWALGRMGARVPMYAEANYVLNPKVVENWINKLKSELCHSPMSPYFIAFCTQVFRLSGDRTLDVSESCRKEVVHKLKHAGASPETLLPLSEFQEVEDSYRHSLFGESIPTGLKLVRG